MWRKIRALKKVGHEECVEWNEQIVKRICRENDSNGRIERTDRVGTDIQKQVGGEKGLTWVEAPPVSTTPISVGDPAVVEDSSSSNKP